MFFNSATFAGVPAVLDFDHTVEKFVAQRWPASRWPFAQSRNDKPVAANPFQGHETLNRFRLPYPDVPAPRINEVIIPTGASRYGRGLFLFDRAGMEQIASQVFGFSGSLESLPDEWGVSDNVNRLFIDYSGDDPQGVAFDREMRALSPTLIDASGANQLWLLPLVDFRYQLQLIPTNITLSQGDTWQDLLTALHDSSGLPGGFIATIPVDPAHGVPDRETFSDPGVSVGVAIDAAVLSLGYRVISTGLGTLEPSSALDSADGFGSSGAKLWLGGDVPSKVRKSGLVVSSRISVDHFGQCGESYDYVFDPDNVARRRPEKYVIHTPWFVEFTRIRQSDDVAIEAVLSSDSDYFSLIFRIERDLEDWGDVQFEYSIPSLQIFGGEGYLDYFSVRVGGVDNLDSVSTHVRSLPPDFAPLVHLGQRPNIYVHPNEAAQFTTLEAKPNTSNWVNSRIVKMDGFYSGSDIRNTLIFVSVNVCAPQLKANTLVMAHYQCEQGWFTTLGMEILPAWEVDATLQEVLKYSDATGKADLVGIRSNFPHIGPPPDVDDGEIEFENPWQLDGLCDSKVVLQHIEGKCKDSPCDAICRVNFSTGGGWSYDSGYVCPAGCACPPLPTDTPTEATSRDLPCIPEDGDSRWEIRQVENRRARWIKFRFLVETPSDITIDEFWDGEDPEACEQDIDIDYPLGTPCVDSDVVASYDPKTYRYKAVSSESAMLGPAETMDIMQAAAFDDCGINYIKQSAKVFPCGSQPSLISIAPILVSLDVITNVDFETTTEPCDTNCMWTWNGTTSTWDQFSTCGPDCTCGPAPTLPPGVWNDFGVSYELPCVATVTGLQFSKSVVEVCSFVTTGPIIIPITPCPAPPVPPGSSP